MRIKVNSCSHNIKISGMLYLPDDYGDRQLTGIVVCHPAGIVK